MKFLSFGLAAGALGILAGCANYPGNVTALHPVIHTDPSLVDDTAPPAIRELSFDSHGKRLNGLIYLANGPGPHPTVVLLHGYPGNEKNLDLAQSLRRVGYNVLFFHYRGAWGSEGEFSFENVIDDVASSLDFLRDNAEAYRVDAEKLILIGHSMGGFAALHGAANDPDVKCVAGVAPADLARIPDFGKEAASGFALYSDTLQMLNGWTGEKAIKELTEKKENLLLSPLGEKFSGKSVLLIAADKDTSVPPAMVTALATAYEANDETALKSITLSGDHSFSWSRYALTDAILDWIEPCGS